MLSASLTVLSVTDSGVAEGRPARLSSTFHRGLLWLLSGGTIIEHVERASLVSISAALAGLSLVSAAIGAPGKFAAAVAYSHCMRAHGVPGFPDPQQTAGGGIEISGLRSGLDPGSPVYLSAQQACRHLLPAGAEPTPAKQQQELAKMLPASRCMRSHGITGFPDPTLSPPSSRAGYSEIMSNGYVWLAIPQSIDVQSPAFEHTAATCKLGLS